MTKSRHRGEWRFWKPTPPLTAREEEAIRAIDEGLTAKEQAQRDGCSVAGVRMARERAFFKLDAANKDEAVARWKQQQAGSDEGEDARHDPFAPD